jgi:hypothetical protein
VPNMCLCGKPPTLLVHLQRDAPRLCRHTPTQSPLILSSTLAAIGYGNVGGFPAGRTNRLEFSSPFPAGRKAGVGRGEKLTAENAEKVQWSSVPSAV